MTPINGIKIPDEFLSLASEWYQGSGSMLYAIASTGSLTTGSIRPSGMTDEEWYVSLFDDLGSELYDTIKLTDRIDTGKHADHDALREFRAWADDIAERLRKEYGIETE